MPLEKSASKKAEKKNIATEIAAGKDPAQAVAIAKSVGRAAKGRKRAKDPAAEVGSQLYPDLTYAGNIIPMSGGYLGNIALINWARSAAIIQKQYDQIAISHRLHNLIRDHVLALGITITTGCEDKSMAGIVPCTDKIVKRTWEGKENRMDLKAGAYLLEASMFGELCLNVSVNPHNGFLKVGYIPVRWIEKTVADPFDMSETDKIILRGGVQWVTDKRYKEGGRMEFTGDAIVRKVIRYDYAPYKSDDMGKVIYYDDPETNERIPLPNPNYGKLAGDVFFSKVPNLLSIDRGRGDTFAVADWINWLDQGVYDFLQRYNAQAAYVYDLLLKGGTPDEIAKASKMKLPTGLKPYAHNELQELTVKSPAIKVDDLTNFIRTMVILIAGTVGVPEMMMADGSMTNVATAAEQTPSLYAMFENRQSWFRHFLETVMRYAIEAANDCGMLYLTDDAGEKTIVSLTREQMDSIQIHVDFTPFERSNSQELTRNIKNVVDAVLQMIPTPANNNQGLISLETARAIVRGFVAQLGVDIDAKTEAVQLAKEAENRGQAPNGNNLDYADVATSMGSDA